MLIKKITLGDGRVVEVEADRYAAIDSIRQNSEFIASMRLSGVRTGDAQDALAFVVNQLAYTESATFDRLYTPLQYEKFIPITSEAGEWAKSIRFEIYDWVGRGKRSSGRGQDINLVDVAFADMSFPVLNGNVGYDYTTEELRESVYLRKPLPTLRQNAAMEAYRKHMNDVGLYGEANGNLTGLFNSSIIPQGNSPNGAWLTTNADNPQLILADLNEMIQAVWTATNYNDQITTCVIAPLRYAYIGSQARSINSDKTILQFLKENNIAKMEQGIDIDFQPGFGLDTAGAGGTARMMGYVKSPQRLIMHLPMPLRFLAPQLKGLMVQIPGEYKYSGVEFRYPKSAVYRDGI